MRYFILHICLLLSFLEGLSQTFEIPEKPSQQTSVYDYASLLNNKEKVSLERKLIKYADSTSNQIVIAIIPSTNGEYIGTLTPKWAHKWGIGDKQKDNGVLILVAKNDGKIWISSGYGLEHKLTAGITGQIIRKEILPEFKKGNYYNGLDKGTNTIFKAIQGLYKNDNPKDDNSFDWKFLLFILLISFIISRIKTKNSNNYYRGFGSGGSFGGGFGGGFGSSDSGGFGGGFDGGGFSGGGSGGSW